MAIRKSNDRSNESDSKYNSIKQTHKAENITERFDDTTHNDNPYDDAIQYLSKKIDECVDEINLSDSSKVITSTQASAITTNSAKTGITSTQAGHITANNAKVGTTSTERSRIATNHAKVGMTVTSGYAVAFTVLESRGAYSIRFDVTGDFEGTKTATLALK